MQKSRSKRARRNPSPRMIKVTVHEERRVNEEQPTPASSPSRNHDSAAPRQHPLICTGAEPIHQVHGPPKPRVTKSMLRQRIHISAIFPPFFDCAVTLDILSKVLSRVSEKASRGLETTIPFSLRSCSELHVANFGQHLGSIVFDTVCSISFICTVAFHLPTRGLRVGSRGCFSISWVGSRLPRQKREKRVRGSGARVGSSPPM